MVRTHLRAPILITSVYIVSGSALKPGYRTVAPWQNVITP